MGASDRKNNKMWEDVFNEATKEASAVSSTVLKSALTEAKRGAGQGPTATQLQKLAEEELKKFEGQRKSMFDKIFATYDTNKDNSLDAKETKTLMSECLKAQKSYLPTQIDSLLEVAIQIALDMAKSMGLTGNQLKAAEKEIRNQFAQVKKKLVTSATLAMDKMIADSETLATTLFAKMDENKDGKISKEEFLRHYQKASSEVVNTQKMLQDLQKSISTSL